MSMTTAPAPKPFLLRIPLVVWASIGVTAALAIGYVLFLQSNYSPIYSDLRPSEAAAVVSELDKEGVHYRLAQGGSEILAPANQADAIRLRLAASEAPLNGEHGFELFDTNDLGLTDFAQKVRYQRALQGELSRTIMMMDGVAEARVHLSIPERTVFRGERRNAEAAVTLVMRSASDETPARIEGVQRLVAASVTDLSPSDVVVLNARGEVISAIASERLDAVQIAIDPMSEANIARIVRNVLPSTPFQLVVQTTAPPLAGDAQASPMTGPSTIINVVTAEDLSADTANAIIIALENAGVVDPSIGRSVAFRVRSLPGAQPMAPRSEATALAAPANREAAPSFNPLIPSAIILLLAVLAGVFILTRPSKTSLPPEEHAQFADQLKAALTRLGDRRG